MKIETQLGTLSARVLGDKEYPGIMIDLIKDGLSLGLALVEVDQSGNTPALKTHVYSVNPEQDEAVFNYTAGQEKEEFELNEPQNQ